MRHNDDEDETTGLNRFVRFMKKPRPACRRLIAFLGGQTRRLAFVQQNARGICRCSSSYCCEPHGPDERDPAPALPRISEDRDRTNKNVSFHPTASACAFSSTVKEETDIGQRRHQRRRDACAKAMGIAIGVVKAAMAKVLLLTAPRLRGAMCSTSGRSSKLFSARTTRRIARLLLARWTGAIEACAAARTAVSSPVPIIQDPLSSVAQLLQVRSSLSCGDAPEMNGTDRQPGQPLCRKRRARGSPRGAPGSRFAGQIKGGDGGFGRRGRTTSGHL